MLNAISTEAIVVYAALALIVGVVVVALVLIVRAVREVATAMARIHGQQETIVRMLLRAGFRPARGSKDWFDEADGTQVAGDVAYTQFDWRRPSA